MAELKRTDENEPRGSRELSLEELHRGYVIRRDDIYTCIFRSTSFKAGVIYRGRGHDVMAERTIREHIQEVHSSTFQPMLKLDKTLSGLTEVQKTLLSCTYEGRSTDEVGEIMGISTVTVHARKFNLQEAKRETKILLAPLEISESEELPVPRPVHGKGRAESSGIEQTDDLFSPNMLHPFFTRFWCKQKGRYGTAEPKAERDPEHNHVYHQLCTKQSGQRHRL